MMPKARMFICALSFVALAIAERSGAGGALIVNVNLKAGEQVADIFTVKADIVSDAGISKVEFSVDDQLRLTVTKAPFEYKWDTVDENEGEHTLIVSAYDAQGNAAAKRVRVEVENGLSLGIKPHAEKAVEHFRKGEYEKASLSGRKAYKINIADPEAIRALAAGVGGLGDYNRALDLLEKQQRINNQDIGDPKIYPMTDPVAMELRGTFRVLRAERQTAIPAMISDLATAYDFWRKLHANYMTDIRKQYPDGDLSTRARYAVGDALFYHGEYEAALAEYGKIKPGSPDFVGAQNRVALTLVRMGRLREAELLTNDMVEKKSGNDATRAVLAMLMVQQRKFAKAHSELTGPISKGSLPALLVASHADIGTGNARRALQELTQVAARASATPDVQYLAAGYFTEAKVLKRASNALFSALRMDPGLLDTYVLRAYQLAVLAPKDGFTQAQALFDFVLERDPRHVAARLGKGMCLVQDKKYRQAEAILKGLSREDRGSGDVWVALAAAQEGMNDRLGASESIKMANQVDPERFKVTVVPPMAALAERVARYRRPPLLTPFLLTLDETGGSAVLPAPPVTTTEAKP